MRRWLAIVLALAGCYHPLNLDSCRVPCGGADQVCPSGMACSAGLCAATGMTCEADAPGPGSDAPGANDGGPPCSSFLATACVDESKAALSLSATLDDTGCPDLLVQSDQSSVCLLSARTVTVDSGTVASLVGPYPVVIAAEAITIHGTLSVASKQPSAVVSSEILGAGADRGCAIATAAVPQTGGGAGGSFGTDGGNGGSGRGDAGNQTLHHGAIQTLAGGCRGDSISMMVPGGHGGGAIWLFAASALTVDGTIDAGGEGGAGGSNELVGGIPGTGGGGGGAGGMIGLESPEILLASTTYLVANGGGGGGGGVVAAGATGGDGGTTQALGGKAATSGSSSAGSGGKGAFASSGGGGDSSSSAGGGGGGGGDGAIYLIGGGTWPTAHIVPSAKTSLP